MKKSELISSYFETTLSLGSFKHTKRIEGFPEIFSNVCQRGKFCQAEIPIMCKDLGRIWSIRHSPIGALLLPITRVIVRKLQ